MAEVKVTKMNKFEMVKAELEKAGASEDLVLFIDNEIALLEKAKAGAAKRRAKKAEEKAAEGDPIGDAVKAALTDEFQGADDILEAIGVEGATLGKVRHRLAQLVKAGVAEKEEGTYTDEDGKKKRKMVYKVVG